MEETLFPIKESFKIKYVVKRDGRIVKFQKDKITDSIFRAAVEVGGSDRKKAEELTEKVIALMNEMYPQGAKPSVEEIQDIIEKVLVENGHYKTAKAYILYRHEHKKLRYEKDIYVEDNIPYRVVYKTFIWNVDRKLSSFEELNEHITSGRFSEKIKECEEKYRNDIDDAVEAILTANPRLVIVAGPSSSGKTTTTIKISERLAKKGIAFKKLEVDNYFKDLEEHPKDEYGDYDFETPQALDLKLINEHIYELIKGKKVMIPEYNFKTGKRRLNAKEFKLEPNEILLIDSLHGLYPEMTSSIPHKFKFKFYIEAMCQIRDSNGEFVRWTDLRMLRRMIRDSWHRSYDPIRTVGHWHYVRRSEKMYIVPFVNKADYVFNGALGYELPIHKFFLNKYIPEIIKNYENDPKKLDALIRAKRIKNIFDSLIEVDDKDVPQDSLLREFIGGSVYTY
ncbi:MAG: ATP cone domain-containing protein [bacterium]|nr:ATP cone domain-containing protein [bacterium]